MYEKIDNLENDKMDEFIDISNVYVWENAGVYNLVELDVKRMRVRMWGGKGAETNGYQTTLIDIFTKEAIYQQNSLYMIDGEQFMINNDGGYFAYLLPIYEVDSSLLMSLCKHVSIDCLKKLCDKLNSSNLKKKRFIKSGE